MISTKELCDANKELEKQNLVVLTWGNVSAVDRQEDIMMIKPSGVPYSKLSPEDLVSVSLSSGESSGDKNPSSDTKNHLELYHAFPGAGSIIHTHSAYATMFAQAGHSIKCMGTTHADNLYGEVPVIPIPSEEEINSDYETNIGKRIVSYFNEKKISPERMPAALVESHGLFVWGRDIKSALENAITLEQVAKMNLGTLILNPSVKELRRSLMDKHYFRKHGEKKYYGQND